MITIGLTGSMGMGKTTTANMLRDMGIPVFDSDAAVHELMGPDGAAVKAVAGAFPGSYDILSKSINRRILRGMVRNNNEKMDLLESILHPLVQDMQQEWLCEQQLMGVKIAAVDIPLLFETHAENRFDHIIVVTCPEFLQRQRVLARGGMTEEDFIFLLNRQMSDAEKCSRTNLIVHTGNGIAYARQELESIISSIRGNEPRHESRHISP